METQRRCPRRSGAARRARQRTRRRPTIDQLVANAQRELLSHLGQGHTVALMVRGEVVQVYGPGES